MDQKRSSHRKICQISTVFAARPPRDKGRQEPPSWCRRLDARLWHRRCPAEKLNMARSRLRGNDSGHDNMEFQSTTQTVGLRLHPNRKPADQTTRPCQFRERRMRRSVALPPPLRTGKLAGLTATIPQLDSQTQAYAEPVINASVTIRTDSTSLQSV